MSKLLYIVGSPRPDSRSGAVAEAYLEAARRTDPGLEVTVLDLWREPLPEFDGDKAQAKMTVITGGTPEVTEVETIRFQPTLLTPDPEGALGAAVAAAQAAAGRLARDSRAA
jgi:FMN-dependent NADH-azoreductase